MKNSTNKKKNSYNKIKYKTSIKPYNYKIKINPKLHKPMIPPKDYDSINDRSFQNKNDSVEIKNNQSTTLNHFTYNKELDAKIKYKKKRIGD